VYPAEFAYVRPGTLDAALRALRDGDGLAKPLAGGQSLLPMMKLRLAAPEVLVDLRDLAELRGVTEDADGLRVGAFTTYRELRACPAVAAVFPVLRDALDVLADPQVRARGTVGGSIAHADPTADLPPVLLALDAVVDVVSLRGRRSVSLDGFLVGVFTTDLADDEIVLGVRLPRPPGGAAGSYAKFEQQASHFALCGVAAQLALVDGVVGSAAVAVTGVTSRATRLRGVERALVGRVPDAATVAAAADLAADGLEALDDVHASAAFRLHLATVLARRALTTAVSRCRAEESR
jgi:aerobic carbon-monoxide dehydrogenase medium subunit